VLTYSQEQSSKLDSIFSALSHPIRRAIIEQVAEGDCTVNDLVEPHDISRPAISQHLKVLIDAELIEQSPQGRVRICSLNVQPLSLAFSWIVRYRIFWDTFLDELQEEVEKTGLEIGLETTNEDDKHDKQ